MLAVNARKPLTQCFEYCKRKSIFTKISPNSCDISYGILGLLITIKCFNIIVNQLSAEWHPFRSLFVLISLLWYTLKHLNNL